MQISISDTRYLLDSPNEYRGIAGDAGDRAMEAESAVTKVTAQLSAVPGGGTSDRNEQIARMIDLKSKWAKAIETMVIIEDTVIDLIDVSPLSDKEKNLLLLRYIHMLPWVAIREQLGEPESIPERTIYNIHNAALDKLTDFINAGGYNEEKIKFIFDSFERDR